jgi:hopanoid biosynthesis associated RND transporter like protein HpnN
MHERWRHAILGWWSNTICHHPKAVLLLSGIAVVAAIGITVTGLTFQSDRNALIAVDIAWNQRFIDWTNHFEAARQFVVVVDSGPDAAHLADARRLVDELGPLLENNPHVDDVVWALEGDMLEQYPGLLRIAPMDELQSRLEQIRQSRPLIESATPAELLAAIRSTMIAAADDDVDEAEALAGIEQLRMLFDAMGRMLSDDAADAADLAATLAGSDMVPQRQYLASDNQRLLFITVIPNRKTDADINPLKAIIESLRESIAQVNAKYPTVEAGLTGIEVIEADETDIATTDSTRATILAFVLITIVLVTAFHSFRTPLLTLTALMTGVAWSFGFLTLTVGHLQVLSVVFAVILLGLGVAFGIHLVSGLELVRHDHEDSPIGFDAAMRETFETVGPGIITGAVTTAAAFMTTMLTDFTGVGEMGWIAGCGVLLCLVAMFAVLPALLRLIKPRHQHVVHMQDRFIHLYEDRWVMPVVRHPKMTLAVTMIITAVSLYIAVTRMHFDYDLLKLQPTGTPSVELASKITDEGGSSIWFGVSVVDDLDELHDLAARFREQPTVAAQLGGVGLLAPPDADRRAGMIAEVRQSLEPKLGRIVAGDESHAASDADALITRLDEVRMLLSLGAFRDMSSDMRAAILMTIESIDQVSKRLNALGDSERQQRVAALGETYRSLRREAAVALDRALGDEPLTFDDLPPQLLRPYDDGAGRYAMLVFPRLPADGSIKSAMAPRFLPKFVDQMASVDSDITGSAPQFYRSGVLIKNAYIKAGVLAFLVVLVLVVIDFGSIIDAILTLLPVAVGFTLTFAVMWLVGMQINPANIIILPLMFGIGVDAGVHMLHRYRLSPTLDPPGLARGTGKGITLTALTTMIGFGSLMIASHRGIFSLGFTMTVGMALTMLSCWLMMPAILVLRRGKQGI